MNSGKVYTDGEHLYDVRGGKWRVVDVRNDTALVLCVDPKGLDPNAYTYFFDQMDQIFLREWEHAK